MKNKFFEKNIEKIVHFIEYLIAIIIAFGIFIGLIDLIKYFFIIFRTGPGQSYEAFQSFLGHCLLLIVGAELILMILYHSTNALLELILFVIARKMLIYSNDVMDLIYGTIALFIVFFTMKYLLPDSCDDIFEKFRNEKRDKNKHSILNND